jgi:hypothetical protein
MLTGCERYKRIDPDMIFCLKQSMFITKADQYQANILETIVNENIKNFEKFSDSFKKNSSDNLTDSFSKDVFTQYVKFNSSGEIDKNEVLNATQNVLKNKDTVENPVTYSDIKTVSSNITNLKIYGNDIAMIQSGVNKGILSLNNKKNKSLYIASIYMKTSELLIQVNVPESLSENHVNLINGLKKYSEGLSMMEEQVTDPAKALLGLKKVKEATDEIASSLNTIKKTIDLNDIIYAPTEPGFLLNKAN